MDNLRRLEEIFSHFPGIGPRQARRFVYHLLAKSPSAIKEFTGLIEEIRKGVSECDRCHRFFIQSNRVSSLCQICSDQTRDQKTLMILSRDSDMESVERSSAYRGLYFILGGTVPVMDKDPEKRIRLRALLENVSQNSILAEIILSLNTTPDGEHTADIVNEALRKIIGDKPVKITFLGRGLSTGAELEYVDSETIKNALKNRN